MPFTFSHPSIILPFLYIPRKWISVTGLIIGSIAPDFEYFLRMRMKSEYSHTIGGVFWFDLPLCLIIAFIFHLIVRIPLIDHLPRFLQECFIIYKSADWNQYFRSNYIVVIISCLIGIASHLLWDSFTHPTGYFARVIPFLHSVIEIGTFSFPGTSLVQKISGIVGGAVVLWLILRLPRRRITKQKPLATYWFTVGVSTSLILFLRWLSFPHLLVPGHFAVAFIGAFLLSLVIAGWIFILRPTDLCRS